MLDEPTAALGVAQTAEVLNLIERLRDTGLGVILISHNMADVQAVADRIVVLRLGRNAAEFRAEEVNTEQLVAAITGASDNVVATRASRAPPRPTRRQSSEQRRWTRRPSPVAADLADERLIQGQRAQRPGRGGLVPPRGGDLGALPVVFGLVDHLAGLLLPGGRRSCPRATWSPSPSSPRRSG